MALPQPPANSTTKVMPMCNIEAIASVDAFPTRSHTTVGGPTRARHR